MKYSVLIPICIIIAGVLVAGVIIGPDLGATKRSDVVKTATSEKGAQPMKVKNAPANARKVTLAIEGMYCAGCRRSVVSTLEGTDGVVKADADPQRDTGWAVYDPATITPEEMVEAPIFDTYPAEIESDKKYQQ